MDKFGIGLLAPSAQPALDLQHHVRGIEPALALELAGEIDQLGAQLVEPHG